ncbi:Uncharacterised protein [uncultured archaeon]|nr:Uncharacterised protein [uncultured archaeon]
MIKLSAPLVSINHGLTDNLFQIDTEYSGNISIIAPFNSVAQPRIVISQTAAAHPAASRRGMRGAAA